jgi:hypothetical protein
VEIDDLTRVGPTVVENVESFLSRISNFLCFTENQINVGIFDPSLIKYSFKTYRLLLFYGSPTVEIQQVMVF